MMRILGLIFMLGFHNSQLLAQENKGGNTIIRVLSFNILHGATTKGDFNLDIIAKVIRDANPDFVALQEVDFNTNRSRKYDLVVELSNRTGLVPLFGRAMYYDGGEYGEGILSKYSFIESRIVALPFTPGSEPRTALEVIVEISQHDTIAFVGTHLDHLKDEKDRLAQSKEINNVFLKNKYPTILAGDLNAEPGSKPIQILELEWTSSYNKKQPSYTYPSSNPVKKIDYVMTYPSDMWRVLETTVIQNEIASDHCAYLVVLELLKH